MRNLFAFAYFLLLFYIVFLVRRGAGINSRVLNIMPLKNTVRAFQEINNHKAQYNFYTNLFGNLLLFLPFSFVCMLVFRIDSRKTVFYAFFFSLSIELLQYLLKKGVADVDDIILNVAGAFVGMLVCKKNDKAIRS